MPTRPLRASSHDRGSGWRDGTERRKLERDVVLERAVELVDAVVEAVLVAPCTFHASREAMTTTAANLARVLRGAEAQISNP